MKKEHQKIIQKLFWYFILFSILGLIIETLFCYLTTGVIESRKGLIWGPFCPVYGVGAIILIISLNKVEKRNYFKLFLYGFLIGSVVEYLLSYGLEAIYGTRFWDYGYTGKDLNGRICMLYSWFWGILAIILMKVIKPKTDNFIKKIPNKIDGKGEILLFIFLVIDAAVTIWGISTYQNRAQKQYYQEEIVIQESKSWISKLKNKIENEYFTNERMKKTFPNLRIKDKNGNEIWIKDILK